MSHPSAGTDDADALYTDDNGIPMLFDVVIPGDYLKAAGVILAKPAAAEPEPEPEPAPPAIDPEALAAAVDAAIEAALPAATERAVATLREALRTEVHQAIARELAPQDRPHTSD